MHSPKGYELEITPKYVRLIPQSDSADCQTVRRNQGRPGKVFSIYRYIIHYLLLPAHIIFIYCPYFIYYRHVCVNIIILIHNIVIACTQSGDTQSYPIDFSTRGCKSFLISRSTTNRRKRVLK